MERNTEGLKDLMFEIIFPQFKRGKSHLWSMFPLVNKDALRVFIALFFKLFL